MIRVTSLRPDRPPAGAARVGVDDVRRRRLGLSRALVQLDRLRVAMVDTLETALAEADAELALGSAHGVRLQKRWEAFDEALLVFVGAPDVLQLSAGLASLADASDMLEAAR